MRVLHRHPGDDEMIGVHMPMKVADLKDDGGCASHSRESHAMTTNVTRRLATDDASG